jgi:hypothetical protein
MNKNTLIWTYKEKTFQKSMRLKNKSHPDQPNKKRTEVIERTLKKAMNLPRSRSQNVISTMREKGRISSGNIRWSSRLRCAETGNLLENASSRIRVLSHMGNTNLWKSNICHQTSKPKLVCSFTRQLSALMEIDVNSCTHSSISMDQTNLTMRKF